MRKSENVNRHLKGTVLKEPPIPNGLFPFSFSGIYLQTKVNYTPKSNSYAAHRQRRFRRHGCTDRPPWGRHNAQPIPAVSAKQNLCKFIPKRMRFGGYFQSENESLAWVKFHRRGSFPRQEDSWIVSSVSLRSFCQIVAKVCVQDVRCIPGTLYIQDINSLSHFWLCFGWNPLV